MKLLASLSLLGLASVYNATNIAQTSMIIDEEIQEESTSTFDPETHVWKTCNPRYSETPCPGAPDAHHRKHHVYNDVYTDDQKNNHGPQARTGEMDMSPVIDILEVKGSKGRLNYFVGGQPITIHGRNLLSKEIDEFTGRFTDVYLKMRNPSEALKAEFGDADGRVKILCIYQGLFPASTDDRLICRTPKLTDQRSTSDNPWSNQQFQIRVEHYVSEVNAMVDIEDIYGDSVYKDGSCWTEQSSCRIYTHSSWGNDLSWTKFYGNKMINGKVDRFFWTEWFGLGDMMKVGDDGQTEETDDADSRKNRWAQMFETQRNDYCDFPINLEVRRTSDLATVSQAGVDVSYMNPFHGVWAFNSSQEEGVTWKPEEWELRWYCDRNVMEIVGDFPDQSPGNVTDANIGISTPKLFSAYDETFLVGECATDYNDYYYPTTLGDGQSGRFNDASETPNWREYEQTNTVARLRCHMQSESNWHGPAKVYVQSDAGNDWYSQSQAGHFENNVWNPTNNFNELFNVYINPAITDFEPKTGPMDGGTELTITGNKFSGSATVKVGYNDCIVKSQTDDQIVCVVQRPEDEQKKCSETNEYPGSPGMNVEYYTEKYYYNKDWGNGWTSIFNEREEHEDYRWTAVSEDGWAQATPNNYLKHGDYDSLNKMTAMTRGFFVAPQSGWYQMTCLGGDHHYLFMNRERGDDIGMCPIDTRQGYVYQDQWNSFMGDWIHMNFTEDTSIASRNNDGSYFMAGSAHTSGYAAIDERQTVSDHIYLTQGEHYSFHGWMTDHSGTDFWSIGFFFHGEYNEETQSYELPEAAQPENLPGQYQYEKQNFKVVQNSTSGIVHETHEISFNQGTSSLEITVSDDFGNTRTANLDLSQTEEEIAASFDNQVFKVDCVYDDGFTAVYEDGFEDSENGVDSLDYLHGMSHQVRSNKHAPFCGFRDYSRFQTVHHWHTPLYDSRHNTNGAHLDILDDDYTHMCFAYYGSVTHFWFRIQTNRMSSSEWVTVEHAFEPALNSGNQWAHICIDMKSEIYNNQWQFRQNSLCGGDCEASTGFKHDTGSIDDMFNKYKVKQIQLIDRSCVSDTCPVYVDEVKLGFLTSGDGAPISRSQGVLATDAKGVGSVSAVKSETSLQLSFDRELYDNTDYTGWEAYHSKLHSHFFPGHKCGWTINEFSVSTAGASSERIGTNGNGFQGEVTIGSQSFNPNSMAAWMVTEAYMAEFGEEVRTVLTADCTSELSYEITWQKEVDGAQRDHGLASLSPSNGNSIVELDEGSTLKNGNIFVARIPGNWLRQSVKTPQVTVSLDGDAALCMTETDDCSFSWSSQFQVDSMALVGSSVQFETVGMWYTEDVVHVQIGEAICENLVQAGSSWTCDVPAEACAGTVYVQVLMRDNLGFATMLVDNSITLEYTLDAVTPNRGSLGGGQVVTLTGSRFCANRVSADSNINGKSVTEVEIVNSTTAIVSMPADGGDTTVEFDLFIGSVAKRRFKYQTLQTPISTSITNDGCSLTGCTVTITGDKFYSTQGESTLTLGNADIEIISWKNVEIKFSASFLPVGFHDLQVLVSGRGWMTGDHQIESKLEINKIYPENSSLYGGENFEIHGTGFGVEQTDVSVTVAGEVCEISTVQDDRIDCSVSTYPYRVSLDTSGSQYDANGNLFPNFSPEIVNIVAGQSVEWCWNLNSGINLEIFGVSDLADKDSAAWKSPRFEDSTSHCYTRVFVAPGSHAYVTDFIDDSFTLQFRGQINVAAASSVSAEIVVSVNAQGTSTNANSNPVSGASAVDACHTNSGSSSSNAERSLASTPVINSFTQSATEFDANDEILFTMTSTDFVSENCMSVFLNDGNNTVCEIKSLTGNTLVCAVTLANAEMNNLVAFTYYKIVVSIGGVGHAVFNTDSNHFHFEPTLIGLSNVIGSINGQQAITISGKALGSVPGVQIYQFSLESDKKKREAPEHTEQPSDPMVSRSDTYVDEDRLDIGYNNLVFTTKSNSDERVQFEVEFAVGNYLASEAFHYSSNDTLVVDRYGYNDDETYANGYSTDDLEVEIKLSNTHVLGNDMSRLTIIFELHKSDVPSAMDAEDRLPFPWNGIKVDTFGLTYCDVHTLEQYRVVCTLRNHLIYARYKAWAFVENFGQAQIEQHWQFRTKEHISIAVASSVSPNGGANVRIESYGSCMVCETQLSIFNMDGTAESNMVASVLAEPVDDLTFDFTLPALPVGEYQAKLGNTYHFKMHADSFQIMVNASVATEINGVTFDNNDINSLTGGELATVSGNFPNCAEASLQILSENVLSCLGDNCVTEISPYNVIEEVPFNCDSNTFIVPSMPVGEYKIRFSDAVNGDSNVFQAAFVYGLTVIGASMNISPGSLGGGNTLSIQIEGASAHTQVSVCDIPCEFVSIDDSTNPEILTCITGKLVEGIDRDCDIVVNDKAVGRGKRDTRANTLSLSSAVPVSLSASPVLTGIDNNRGGSAGGSTIVMTGSNFQGTPTVAIDGIECIVSEFSETEITCVTEAAEGLYSKGVPTISVDNGDAWFDESDESLVFAYVDLWSSVFTWGGVGLPQQGEIIVVGPGQHLVLDVDTPLLKALVVMGGTFEVDREIAADTITLAAEYIIVTQDGHFKIGTEEEPYPCDKTAEIVLFGHRRSINLPIFGSKVLAVRSGKLDLHGCKREVPWTMLGETVEAGSEQITLERGVDWRTGDEIAIATTGGRRDQYQSEKRVITAVSEDERTVTLDSPLLYRHLSVEHKFMSATGEERTLNQKAEVGVLSRNVIIRGNRNTEWDYYIPACAEEANVGLTETQSCFEGKHGEEIGSDRFGAQVMVQNIEYAKIEYVEFTHTGQAFGLGRYSLHFHISGDQPNSYVRGCGIHETFNRACTIHATNELTVEHNVVYRVMGQTIFIEDGIEINNVIQYNLVMNTLPSSSLLNVDQTPTSFWITNPKNTVRHNHAVGSSHFGFWYNPPANPTGPSFTMSYCPNREVFGEFFNNTAHTIGTYGMWIFEDYKATMDGQCRFMEKDNSLAERAANVGNYFMDTFISWGCERGVEFTKGSGLGAKRFLSAGNVESNIAFMQVDGNEGGSEFERSAPLVDSITSSYLYIEGDDEFNAVWGPGSPHHSRAGIELPGSQSKHNIYYVRDHAFYNSGDHDGRVAMQPCYHAKTYDCGEHYYMKNILWGENTVRRTNIEWEHQFQIIDEDGSYTETGSPSILVPRTGLAPADKCFQADPVKHNYYPSEADLAANLDFGLDGLVCAYPDVKFVTVGFKDEDPSSLKGFPATFTNEHGSAYVNWRFKRNWAKLGWQGFMLSDTTNTIEFPGMRVNHTFGSGYIEGLDHGRFVRVQAVVDENIGSMLWGENVLSRNDTDMTVENEPTMSDATLSYNMATRTGIFHTNDSPVGKSFERVFFSYIAFAGDIPPAPPADDDDEINFRTCNWSDASCWSEGIVPGNGDIVLVEVGQTVVVDIAHVEVDYIYVMGNLEFDDSVAMSFTTKGIQVGADAGYQFQWSARRRRGTDMIRSRRNVQDESTNATVSVGSSESPWPCNRNFEFVLKGDHTEVVGAHDGSLVVGAKSIAVFHGLEMYGCPVETTSTILQNSVFTGETSITLVSPPTGWRVGGKIVIAPSGVMYTEFDEVTIDSINGAVVTFTPALNFNHFGKADTTQTYANGDVLNQGAEVIYTTRNVKIGSQGGNTESDWNYGIGGRVVVNKMSTYDAEGVEKEHFGYAQISNVEFSEMGQLGFSSVLDPRYALTFYRTAGVAGSNRPTLKDSFVKNCAFNNGYWTAIGSFFTDDLEISDNNVFNTLNGGVHVYGSDDNIVDNNAMIYLRNKQMYFVDQGFSLNNSNADVDGTSRGIYLQNTFTTYLTNNAVAGLEVGVGYDIHGEACDEVLESCASSSEFTSGSRSSGNSAHALAIGVQVYKDRSAKCGKISGFTIYMARRMAVYVQTTWDTLVIENVKVFDSQAGVIPTIYKPDPKYFKTTMKSVNIRNSLFAGLSDTFDCNVYDNWATYGKYNWDWFSHMQPSTFADGSSKAKNWFGVSDAQCWNKYNKYPKAKPASISGDGGKPTVNCNMCMFDNSFEWESNKCTSDQFSALAAPRSAMDSHGEIRLLSGNSFAGTPELKERTQFLNPRLSKINPSDCQDMSGDFNRRRMIVDEEGVLSGTGARSTISSVSEYEWDGNPSYGLGDNRIPMELYTALDGSKIPLEDIRTYNGAVRSSDCTKNSDINAYICGNSRKYTYLVVESLDEDSNTRRMGPLAIRSNDGYLDLVNGACDHSCCNGYSCSLRPSLFKLHVACGMEYEIYGSSSLPKHTRFHLPYQTEDCKIKISLFTMRQNRVDVYEGADVNGEFEGSLMAPTNTRRVNSDGSFDYDRPDPVAHIPSVGLNAGGDNFLDRTTELLHVVMKGSKIYDFVTASSVVLNLDVVTEIDIEELFDSDDFPTYLAALLGVDPSMIRVMDVVREDSIARSTSNKKSLTIEIGPPAESGSDAPAPDAPTTIETLTTNFDFTTDSDFVVTTVTTTTEDQSIVIFNQDDVANSVFNSVISGGLQETLENNMGLTTEGDVAVQVAPPAVAPVPEWYGINSEMGVPWYVQYGCTEPEYLAGTCDAPVNEDTLDLYSDQQEAENELLSQQTNTQVLAVPSHLYLVEAPTDPQLAGGNFHQAVKVGMYDTDGNVMEVVGIASQPWTVQIEFVTSNFDSGSNRLVGTTEAEFKVSGPNKGMAVFRMFGVELDDTNIELQVSVVNRTESDQEGYITPVSVTGLTALEFPAGNCTSEEGINPDNFAWFDVKQQWVGTCESVCTLPCEGNELNCYNSNKCSNALMNCDVNGDSSSCSCGDTSSVTEATFADHIDVQCTNDSMSVRINKCAVNQIGFGLNQLYMSGMEVNYNNKGQHACYGELAFDGDGIDYVWQTDFTKCGTVNNTDVFTNVIQGIEGDYATGQMAHPAFFVEFGCSNGLAEVNVVHAGSEMETVDSYVENFDLVGGNAVPSKISIVNKIDSSSDVYNFETSVSLEGRDLVMQLNKCWLSSSPDASSQTATTTDLINMGCSVNDQVEVMLSGRKKRVHFAMSLANDIASGQEFIHCNMAACDSSAENCVAECV